MMDTDMEIWYDLIFDGDLATIQGAQSLRCGVTLESLQWLAEPG
jgi:hypothetical protein